MAHATVQQQEGEVLSHENFLLLPSDRMRIWFQMKPRHLPTEVADALRESLAQITLRSAATMSCLSLALSLALLMAYPPNSLARISWHTLHSIGLLAIFAGVIHLFRLERQRISIRRKLNRLFFPLSCAAGMAWGSVVALPTNMEIPSDGEVSQIYIALSISTVAVFGVYVWMLATWVYGHIGGLGCIVIALMLIDQLGLNSTQLVVIGVMYASFLILFSLIVCNVILTLLIKRINADHKTARANALLTEFKAGASDWYWEADPEGRLRYVPERMVEAAAGRPVKPGMPFVNLLCPDDATSIDAARRLRSEAPFTGLEVRLSDSPTTWWKISGRPLYNRAGTLIGHRCVGSDISSHKRLAILKEAEVRYEAIAGVTSRIAHDFNNILGSIRLASGMMRLDADAAAHFDEAIGAIERSCDRGDGITSQLLSYLESDIDLRPLTISVSDLLLPTVDEFLDRRRGAVQVSLNCAPDLMVNADFGRARDAFEHLLDNAARAMQGSGRIEVAAEPGLSDDGREMINILVADAGPGIPEQNREAIFEPFFTTRRGEGGTGLGLSMARGFAVQSGGSLSATSTASGAVFTLSLPAAIQDTIDLDEGPPAPLLRLPSAALRVLVLEDDAELSQVLLPFLRIQGYEVAHTPTLDGAMHALSSAPEPLDLLISDIMLPDGYGFEAVRKARSLWPTLPVVFTSGYTDKLPAITSGDPGTVALPKPFDLHQLSAAIHSVMPVAAKSPSRTDEQA